MANAPIFFDVTGKRRKVVNFLLPLLLLIFAMSAVYTGYYIFRLNKINKLVETSEAEPESVRTNSVMLYTDNHPRAYSILSDQIEKLDSVLLPQYSVSATEITTPDTYKTYNQDLDFISNNKPVHYTRGYILSSKNFAEPLSDREQNLTETSKIDAKLSEIISVNQILAIRSDMAKKKAGSLYVDLNLSVIKDKASAEKFANWLSNFKTLLQDKNIQLGLIVQPTDLNQFNKSMLQLADINYVQLKSDIPYSTQIDRMSTFKDSFVKNTVFEIPTMSTEQDTRTWKNYIQNIDYVTAQQQILDTNIANRTTDSITITKDFLKYQINDAIIANNIIIKLGKLELTGTTTQYAIANPGYEEYTTWKLIESPYEQVRNNYLLSENSRASLDIKTVGEGQIYSLGDAGQYGTRKVEITEDTGIIASKIQKVNDIPVVNKAGQYPKKIALTFDDGPHPTRTRRVLDILDKYNVKATFFMVGSNVRSYPAVAKDVVNRGHEVENHTFDHPVFSKLASTSQISQIKATSEIIEELTGEKVKFFRKPYSDNNTIATDADVQYLNDLKNLGISASEYDIDSKDWLLDTSDQIVEKVKKDLADSAGDYSQILFHDTHADIEKTLDALPKIIDYIRSQGIEIVRVDQLASSHDSVKSSATTRTYRAVDVKNRLIIVFVWLNIFLICLSLFRYGIMIIGSIIYSIKHRLSGLFFTKLDNSLRHTPRLNIIIACYNEEMVIARTIQSLLDNTYKNISIIIINDGSTDRTKDIVELYVKDNKNKVKLINVPNGGKAEALQIGVKHVKSKWIVFCDADTLFDKNALYNFANTFFTNKGIGAVAGRIIVGNDINSITRSQVIEYGVSHIFIKSAQDVINSITVVPGASGLWSRLALEEIGGFKQDTLAEDADATMSLIGHGKRVRYNSSVSARTEAPSDMNMLYKQRTRWQLGNMQAVIKHRRGLFNHKYGILGFFGLPMFYIELLTTLLYPMLLLFSIFIILNDFLNWGNLIPSNVSFVATRSFVVFSMSLLITEILLALFVIITEKKSIISKIKLILTMPYYLFFFKSFLSFATIISFLRALRGTLHGWGHLKRTATVK